MLFVLKGLRGGLLQALYYRQGFIDGGAEQGDGKAITAVAGQKVAESEIPSEDGGDVFEQTIASAMPKAVVDVTHPAYVEDDESTGLISLHEPSKVDGELLLEGGPGEDAQIGVEHGALAQPVSVGGDPAVHSQPRQLYT